MPNGNPNPPDPPPVNTVVELPYALQSLNLRKNIDSITFKVTATCTSCHSDPTPCFPSFLTDGLHSLTTPPSTYGPYTPDKTGSVQYNAVTSGECTTSSPAATLCTITVSS